MSAATVDALETLRRHGMRVVLSSNSAQHFVDELAARCSARFDLALGLGRGLAKGKPHVVEIERRLGVAAERTLSVGDSLKDGELAASCGQRFVGIGGTFDADDFTRHLGQVLVIGSIAELPGLLLQHP